MKSKLMLDSQIEAVLFWKAEPISIKRLSEILERNESEIKSSILILEKRLEGSGLSLIQMNDEITLSTSVEVSSLIIKLTKEELIRDLGKAGLETISIILYQGPISRAEIDYIRGVNSQFIIRNLIVRGLVDKVDNPNDQRSFLYKATFELISYLGISKISDLPDFETVKKDIENFKNSKDA